MSFTIKKQICFRELCAVTLKDEFSFSHQQIIIMAFCIITTTFQNSLLIEREEVRVDEEEDVRTLVINSLPWVT